MTDERSISGAESLVHTLVGSGVDHCFTNPGTSEMHFVAALDRVPGIRCVLALFEGVATGAADGYARLTGRPAATLLHCGPGLANGLANLHNAQRARVPLVNIIGDQATYHRGFDAPLTSDIEGWARPVSVWTQTARSAESVGLDAAAAVQAARDACGIATLILPSNVSWNQGGVPARPLPVASPLPVAPATITAIARVLRTGEPAILMIAGAGLEANALADAHSIASATGAKLFAPTFNRLIQRGRGRHPIALLPYRIDQAVAALAGIRHLILVGAQEPAGFFAYPDKPSLMKPDGSIVHVLARPEEDVVGALAALAEELAAPPVPVQPANRPEPAHGPVTSAAVAQTLAALIPENAVIVDESISFGFAFYPGTKDAAPHEWLQVTGGAIGGGLPLATGAAVAAPGRRVINFEGDGSALYTIQALWTQARERLNVTTVILSNRKYAILELELANVGANPGRTALDLFDLGNPALDWIRLAEALGVEGARAETLEELADLLAVSNQREGPFLIELVIP
ncbi:MAG TPA: acetolactate synthase large subunit [Terriglobales bacterium]|nr:acetolactate synthase large subunit [Terriglobales bacterium]